MNMMNVITETGKEFKFLILGLPGSIQECLEENKTYISDDEVDKVIIKGQGKDTLKYRSKKVNSFTVEGKRAKLFIENANKVYNEIRRGILKELREKPEYKNLECLVVTEEQIKEEVADAFNTDPKVYGLKLYKDDTKRFIKFFSKIDKSRKKELLNEIFSCDYENKEVIEWLNKNELELLREAGFNG